MERKTIGSFIAALRKANGLTQKQLAEKLCVSDKAISRWERDECAPDLSAIPVLAEIFGVTCDELLKGQRMDTSSAPPEKQDASREKQLRRLLDTAATRYKTLSIVSAGIALVGLFAGMICNFAFLRAYLGFWIGCVFLAAAAVFQTVITIRACDELDTEEFSNEAVSHARLKLFDTCHRAASVIAAILGMLIPFLFVGDAYFGITFAGWLPLALLFTLAGLLVSIFAGSLLMKRLTASGFFAPDSRRHALQRLRVRYAGLLILSLVSLWLLHLLAQETVLDLIRRGTTFDNWQDFKTYMETPYHDTVISGSWFESVHIESVMPENGIADNTYYKRETVYAKDGTILCEYEDRNEDVSTISFNFENSKDGLPVTVYTYSDNRRANLVVEDLVNPIFFILYALSPIAVFLLYRRKAKQLA